MTYGPHTKEAAKLLYQVYLDALVLGSTDKETARKYMAFYQMYL